MLHEFQFNEFLRVLKIPQYSFFHFNSNSESCVEYTVYAALSHFMSILSLRSVNVPIVSGIIFFIMR